MYRTVAKIDGMHCTHCEASVEEALRAAFDVQKINVSHEAGEAVVVAEEALAEDAMRSAIAETGFALVSVESSPYEKESPFARFGGGAR